jgi:hypothetical protein
MFFRKLNGLVTYPFSGRRRLALLAAPAAVAAGIALTPAVASHAATTASGQASARAGGGQGGLPVLELTMNGTSITVGGTRESGAVRVVSDVTDKAEAQNGAEPSLARLDPGVSYAQFFQVFNELAASPNSDPNNLYGVAQIVYSTQANLGKSSAMVDLAAGSYVAVDLGTSGRPPYATFTIRPSAHPAALPAPGATITSIDFGFTGATQISDGEVVRWANAGFVVHMIIGIEAPSLATAQKIAADLKAGNDNAAQGLATGSFGWDGQLSHGQSFESVVTQRPGFWVIACFMDTQDGREHTTLGMERVIHIVK